jgi:hypothetical protein
VSQLAGLFAHLLYAPLLHLLLGHGLLLLSLHSHQTIGQCCRPGRASSGSCMHTFDFVYCFVQALQHSAPLPSVNTTLLSLVGWH